MDLAGGRDKRLGTAKIYGVEMSGPRRFREKEEKLNTHADLSPSFSVHRLRVENQPAAGPSWLLVAEEPSGGTHLIAEKPPRMRLLSFRGMRVMAGSGNIYFKAVNTSAYIFAPESWVSWVK